MNLQPAASVPGQHDLPLPACHRDWKSRTFRPVFVCVRRQQCQNWCQATYGLQNSGAPLCSVSVFCWQRVKKREKRSKRRNRYKPPWELEGSWEPAVGFEPTACCLRNSGTHVRECPPTSMDAEFTMIESSWLFASVHGCSPRVAVSVAVKRLGYGSSSAYLL
jgi:hypothetical protein